MAHREFTDSKRVTWSVWQVYPTLGDRRGPIGDRRVFIREDAERRTAFNPARVSAEYACGWLTFQSEREKRRLAPVPEGWESLDERALESLCEAATPAGRPRRLLA
jgi:hypothetical protein